MSTVAELWNRANVWFQQNAPCIQPLLSKGASEDEIKELERKAGVTLPSDFKESYRIHNGFDGGYFFGSVHSLNTFQTVEEIVAHWEQGDQNKNAVENSGQPWDPRWIPFGKDRYCNAVCLDLSSSQDDHYGRVIQCFVGGSSFELASSFTDFLRNFVDDLEKDQFKISGVEEVGLLGLIYKGFNG